MRPVPNQTPSADPGPLRLALVGEAPGADEVAPGQPFCGKSGWLLNGWLASAGISRSQCFVGNVSQCRPSPTSNEFHLFEWNEARVQEGIAALREDLARFRPNIVVALGNAALHLLRHGNVAPPKSQKLRLFQWTSHVGTWRGSLFEGARSFDGFEAAELRFRESQRGLDSNVAEAGPGTPGLAGVGSPLGQPLSQGTGSTPVSDATLGEEPSGSCIAAPPPRDERCLPAFKTLATYHPAATFREPSFTYPLVSDLKRAVAEARSPELHLPPRNVVWGLSTAEVEGRCEALRAARLPVGFDIEGGLGGLQCCSFATSPGDAFVIDLMAPGLDRAPLYKALASVLEDPNVPKVAWNAAYERAILDAVASIRLRAYEDGMLAWWERFSELPKSLDFVASLLTREPYWAEGIGWDRKTGAPKVTGPRFWRYNGIDSCVTLEIWEHPIIRNVVESRSPVAFAL